MTIETERGALTIETERGALDNVSIVELVQWANRQGLELVGNGRGGMTLRKQRPITSTGQEPEHANA